MSIFRRVLNAAAFAAFLCQFHGYAQAQTPKKAVTVAYQTTFSPWIDAMATKAIEKKTGYEINWRKFNSGADIIAAMASGNIDVGVLGSSPLAVALSSGIDIKLFWILEDIANAEGLIVRNSANIHKPEDLIGKTIAVPTASTSQFQLMYILKKWGIAHKVNVINLSPEQAAAAWELGNIDGAFIWGPSLSAIRKTGHTLVSAGEICKLGRCTFEGLTVSDKFAGGHASFLKSFVQIINASNQDFLKHPRKWDAQSEHVRNIAQTLGGTPKDVLDTITLYKYPSIKEQTSCEWLGCGDQGGAAKTLRYTAEFLKQQKRIDKVLPSYADGVTPAYLQ
ncbi:MAG: taurine ABC transporter substrate-binding protein [Candidimonas sp.]|nr:MAG: taurine ABC transporter substrate-binding protein [Candidimonas sp.]TAM26514.1 MAG: taurine ABC transporter substrate-binding protein [Candidimonas sp.]